MELVRGKTVPSGENVLNMRRPHSNILLRPNMPSSPLRNVASWLGESNVTNPTLVILTNDMAVRHSGLAAIFCRPFRNWDVTLSCWLMLAWSFMRGNSTCLQFSQKLETENWDCYIIQETDRVPAYSETLNSDYALPWGQSAETQPFNISSWKVKVHTCIFHGAEHAPLEV